MPATPGKQNQELLRVNERKWCPALWAAGWTGFPSVILKYQHKLGLEPIDVNLLLQLAQFWWEAQRLPRPTKDTIAAVIGRSSKTVQRRIAALEQAGLIHRIPGRKRGGGRGANEYSFQGLIKSAKPYAEAELRERKSRQETARRQQRSRGFRVTSLEMVEDGGKDES